MQTFSLVFICFSVSFSLKELMKKAQYNNLGLQTSIEKLITLYDNFCSIFYWSYTEPTTTIAPVTNISKRVLCSASPLSAFACPLVNVVTG